MAGKKGKRLSRQAIVYWRDQVLANGGIRQLDTARNARKGMGDVWKDMPEKFFQNLTESQRRTIYTKAAELVEQMKFAIDEPIGVTRKERERLERLEDRFRLQVGPKPIIDPRPPGGGVVKPGVTYVRIETYSTKEVTKVITTAKSDIVVMGVNMERELDQVMAKISDQYARVKAKAQKGETSGILWKIDFPIGPNVTDEPTFIDFEQLLPEREDGEESDE